MAKIKMKPLMEYNYKAFRALVSDCTEMQRCEIIEQLIEDMKPDKFVQLLPLPRVRSIYLFILYEEAEEHASPANLDLEEFMQQYGTLYVKKSHYYFRGSASYLCHTGRTKDGLFVEVVEPAVTYDVYKRTAISNIRDGTFRPIQMLKICAGRIVKDKRLVAWVDEENLYNVPN